ncbi:tRNA lysidine(34) synthetase TilS [Escherichia coli]
MREMLAMSDARRAAIIRRWLAGQNAPMPSRDALVGSGRKWRWRGKMPPLFTLGAFELPTISVQLWWIKSVTGQSETIVPWADVAIPAGITGGAGKRTAHCGGDIRPPRADEAVSVRFKAAGLLHIVGRNGGRKLKKFWQELGVPPWRRDTTRPPFYGETLIAAAGGS